MSFIHYSSREINCKIVYYGPGLCGKTTNIRYIYNNTNPESKGKLVSIATETEHTLFFDFLPIFLGTLNGFKLKFHLYTVPGQIFYEASRKLILKGVDGIVFVADSQVERMDANMESMDNLRRNLTDQDIDINYTPLALQYNKRDLPNIMPIPEMNGLLNTREVSQYESIASKGEGVFETLKDVTRQVISELKKAVQLG
ncbi:MAG: gliding-motility protein MglA [Nitrospirae bacterium RIFCSPLOW2_12_42_9]|nr:MAG: gliding-motility protein MglA [Nitrospirae bacterium GWA2_42_11]OGW58551.1 MAG: gliding-motility protein MglA [Nitrospirae bacterium RIFCSPLOW2_12_42_9]OGW59313.1 MAG: gliding-motility protein MglA [Nitrospirae bacterium RIFCSPHIGHO2_02_FULL_42_12]HAS17856.1 gliding-motility protein MglA [Nitrospiraceae bacterium]